MTEATKMSDVDVTRWRKSRKGASPERRSGYWKFIANCPGKGTHTVETDGVYGEARDRAMKIFRASFGRKKFHVELAPGGKDFEGESEEKAPPQKKGKRRGKRIG
jgi:hypothetical protein